MAWWRLAIGALERAPLPLAFLLGHLYVRVVSLALPEKRRVVLRNLEVAGFADPARLLREFRRNLARLVVECARLPTLNHENISRYIRVDGMEHFQEARKLGRGVLIASGHLGNWELGSYAAPWIAEPMHILVRRYPQSPAIDEFVAARRAMSGNRLIGDREGAWKVAKALRRGEIVCVLIDADPAWVPFVTVQFFGKPVRASTALARLAAETGAPVMPVFVRWSREEKRYIMQGFPVVDISGDAVADTQRLYDLLERLIRQYPAQWFWPFDQNWIEPVERNGS